MRIFFTILILQAFFTSLLGCQLNSENTSTGNPLVSLTVTGSAQATTALYPHRSIFEKIFLPSALALPAPALFDSALRPVSLNEFWIVIKDIEVSSSDSALGSSAIQAVGPFVINLLLNSPSPVTTLYAPSSGLKSIRTKLEKASTVPTGAPTELMTNSVVIKGSVSGYLLTVLLADGIEYQVSGPNTVFMKNGSRLLLTLQTADLFKKIDLGAVTADTVVTAANRVSSSNPCPSIDPSAADLYTCFRNGLRIAANVGEDADGDSELDPTEESVK